MHGKGEDCGHLPQPAQMGYRVKVSDRDPEDALGRVSKEGLVEEPSYFSNATVVYDQQVEAMLV